MNIVSHAREWWFVTANNRHELFSFTIVSEDIAIGNLKELENAAVTQQGLYQHNQFAVSVMLFWTILW